MPTYTIPLAFKPEPADLDTLAKKLNFAFGGDISRREGDLRRNFLLEFRVLEYDGAQVREEVKGIVVDVYERIGWVEVPDSEHWRFQNPDISKGINAVDVSYDYYDKDNLHLRIEGKEVDED